jgi:hypothetical protein
VVRDGTGRHFAIFYLLDKRRQDAGAVEEAILRVKVQMDELGVIHRE